MIDDKTPLGWPLPHPGNDPFAVDVPRLRDALTQIDAAISAVRDDLEALPGAIAVEEKITAAIAVAIAELVDTAPGALDTLNELAAALGDDPNFAATIAGALALAAPLASPELTGSPTAPTAPIATNNTQLATTAFVRALLAGLSSVTGATLTAPTRTAGDNTKNVANTEFVKAALDALTTTLTTAIAAGQPAPGDLMDSFKLPGTGSPDWFEANGAILTKAANPGLFAAIGNTYGDMQYVAAGNSFFISPNEMATAYVNGKIFIMSHWDADVPTADRIAISEDDGLTFTPSPSARRSYGGLRDMFYIGGRYVGVPKYSSSSAQNASNYSAHSLDGKSWTYLIESGFPTSSNPVEYASDGTVILARIYGDSRVWRKSSPTAAFSQLAGSGLSGYAEATESFIAAGNGVFLVQVYDSGRGERVFYRSTDKGDNWTKVTALSFGGSGTMRIRFINGFFYAWTHLTGQMFRSADGLTWTTFVNISTFKIIDVFTDGDKILIRTEGNAIVSVLPDGSLYYLKFNTSGLGNWIIFTRNISRQSDGLIVAPTNTSLTVYRVKPPYNKATEFQIPVFASPVSGAKRFIRGK